MCQSGGTSTAAHWRKLAIPKAMQYPKAIALDAFGALILAGWKRLNSCRLVLADRLGDYAERLPFLTSNVPSTTFSTELKLEHLMPDSEMKLAKKFAEYRAFNDVPVVLFSPSLQACALRFTPTLHKTMGMSCAVFCPISMHPSRALKWVRSSCSQHLCGNLQNLGQ